MASPPNLTFPLAIVVLTAGSLEPSFNYKHWKMSSLRLDKGSVLLQPPARNKPSKPWERLGDDPKDLQETEPGSQTRRRGAVSSAVSLQHFPEVCWSQERSASR